MSVNDKCPHCHGDLNGIAKNCPDTRAIHTINQLKVYCKNKEAGCKWEGELRHAETHHDSCPYRQVECPVQFGKAIRSIWTYLSILRHSAPIEK